MEKKLAILSALILILNITSAVYADVLYDLYSDHGSPATSTIDAVQQKHTKHPKKIKKQDYVNNIKQVTTPTNNQNNGAQSVYKAVNQNQGTIIQKGSQNYSSNGYTASRKLTNPINIDNPYSNLNSHRKNATTDNNAVSIDNVTFKKDIWGNINGYNSEGKKIGTYQIK